MTGERIYKTIFIERHKKVKQQNEKKEQITQMDSLKDYHIGRISWKLNIYGSKHIIHGIISTSGNWRPS